MSGPYFFMTKKCRFFPAYWNQRGEVINLPIDTFIGKVKKKDDTL
jgi:hypothetical protein